MNMTNNVEDSIDPDSIFDLLYNDCDNVQKIKIDYGEYQLGFNNLLRASKLAEIKLNPYVEPSIKKQFAKWFLDSSNNVTTQDGIIYIFHRYSSELEDIYLKTNLPIFFIKELILPRVTKYFNCENNNYVVFLQKMISNHARTFYKKNIVSDQILLQLRSELIFKKNTQSTSRQKSDTRVHTVNLHSLFYDDLIKEFFKLCIRVPRNINEAEDTRDFENFTEKIMDVMNVANDDMMFQVPVDSLINKDKTTEAQLRKKYSSFDKNESFDKKVEQIPPVIENKKDLAMNSPITNKNQNDTEFDIFEDDAGLLLHSLTENYESNLDEEKVNNPIDTIKNTLSEFVENSADQFIDTSTPNLFENSIDIVSNTSSSNVVNADKDELIGGESAISLDEASKKKTVCTVQPTQPEITNAVIKFDTIDVTEKNTSIVHNSNNQKLLSPDISTEPTSNKMTVEFDDSAGMKNILQPVESLTQAREISTAVFATLPSPSPRKETNPKTQAETKNITDVSSTYIENVTNEKGHASVVRQKRKADLQSSSHETNEQSKNIVFSKNRITDADRLWLKHTPFEPNATTSDNISNCKYSEKNDGNDSGVDSGYTFHDKNKKTAYAKK